MHKNLLLLVKIAKIVNAGGSVPRPPPPLSYWELLAKSVVWVSIA